MNRDQRRLTAIVSADVVGYSRLMGHDESGTLARLKGHLRELIDPKVAEYGGRTVKSMGDGLLLEFPSVVDAVRCVVDMQRGMAERNVSVAADQQIVFRIGINVGDIIIDGADIFGDGVNVAARLQTLAEPGGICVSRNVRDQVLDKLGFAFEDLGTQEVKNIARAIEVYRIRDEMAIRDVGQPSRANAQQSSRWKRFRGLRWAIAAGVFVCSLGVAAWYFLIPSKSVAVATGAPAMSVAIMPFVPASAGDGDKQLADVLTLDLTTALQRSIRGALVVSHGLAARYQGASPDPRVVGRDLNVRYLIEGKVQTVDAGTSVSTRLVNTDDGIQLWSDPQATSRGPMSDRIEEIVAQISNRVRPALVAAEDKRIAGLPTSSASAASLLRSAYLQYDLEPGLKGVLAARKLGEEALKLDPAYVPALLFAGDIIARQIEVDPSADHARLIQELGDISSRAITADREDPRAWNLRAGALMRQHRWDGAFAANTEALRIDPHQAETIANRARLLVFSGKPAEALPLLERVIALNPRDPVVFAAFGLACRSYLMIGRYDDAIVACENAVALQELWPYYLYLTAAHAQKGDMAKAASAKVHLLKLLPTVSIARVKALRLSDVPAFWQQTETHMFAGLRKAGIPEE